MPIINIWCVPAAAIAILGLCSITTAGQAKADGKNEQQAVLQAVMGFYDALAVIFEGDTGAMEKIWSHTDDVTYMGPGGGYLEGWEQVRENWRKQAEVQMGSGGGYWAEIAIGNGCWVVVGWRPKCLIFIHVPDVN